MTQAKKSTATTAGRSKSRPAQNLNSALDQANSASDLPNDTPHDDVGAVNHGGPASTGAEAYDAAKNSHWSEEDGSMVDDYAIQAYGNKKRTVLNAPDARPNYEQRFVQTLSADGKENNRENVATRLQGGWRPRDTSTFPKSFFASDMEHDFNSNVYVVRGMCLMERPVQIGDKIRALTDSRTAELELAVNDELGVRTSRHTGFGNIEREYERDADGTPGGNGGRRQVGIAHD